MDKYYSSAEISKIVKRKISTFFPNIKFSVRKKDYSEGCSLDIIFETEDIEIVMTVKDIAEKESKKHYNMGVYILNTNWGQVGTQKRIFNYYREKGIL